MSSDPQQLLRQAAVALLGAAPLAVVHDVLQRLLAGTEVAERSPPKPAPPVRPRGRPASANATWLALRRRVREALTARGMNQTALAATLGYSVHSIHTALGRRTPCSRVIMGKLTAWLEQSAPEVAAQQVTFHRSSARTHASGGNGADRHASDRPAADARADPAPAA